MEKDLTIQPDRTAVAEKLTRLWQPLTNEQRQLFAESILVKSYDRGDLLFDVGSTPCHLMYLMRGKVTLSSQSDNDRSQIVRMVAPGDIFGYRPAFTNEPHLFKATTGDNTVVAMVPINTIFHLIWENSQFAMVFLQDLSTLLGVSTHRMRYLTQKRLPGRLAEVLLRMKEKYGVESDGKTLAVYLSREDLASMSNMNTGNAIRTLSSFAADGIVALEGRKIRILDEAALNRIAQVG